jgi:hypothetical protein
VEEEVLDQVEAVLAANMVVVRVQERRVHPVVVVQDSQLSISTLRSIRHY